MLPLLPITLLTLGSLVEQQNSVLIRYFFIGLIFLGFFIQIPAVIVDHSRYLSQQLSVEDQSSAYTQTLYNMAYSPIFQQWGQTLDLLKIYSKSENWRAASDVLDRLQLAGGGTRNGKVILVSEFLRRNTLDFWWLNGFLLSPSLGNH